MRKDIEELYRAKRRLLEAEAAALEAEDEAALVLRLQDALQAASDHQDPTEANFRLQVLAELLAKVSDRDATLALVMLLNGEDASVRATAIEQLRRVARRGRLAEVFWAVGQALERGLNGPAASMLPELVLTTSFDEEAPPPLDLLVQLADHEDPAACAEALCALTEFDGEGVTELLSSFSADDRQIPSRTGEPGTVGELARQLLMVRQMEDEMVDRADAGEGDVPLA